MEFGDTACLALATLEQQPTVGIPTFWLNLMEHAQLDRLAGAAPGSYRREPVTVYLAAQRAAGVCALDQFIPTNPLTMGDHGYEGAAKGATTGAHSVVVDERAIDSPEAVAAHLTEVEFDRLRAALGSFDEDARTAEIVASEAALQAQLGPSILKTGYSFARFPVLPYTRYGYVPYLSAVALYPDVMERHFALQGDLAIRHNRAAARAYREAGLPPLYRLDHDLADSRGILIGLPALERLWLPHFARSLEPLVKAGVKLIWHCDGNLMDLLPRLVDCGVKGFQGFQYEDGMDYRRICRLQALDGADPLIVAGVSVSTTMPHGTPRAVRDELRFLVDHGPATGLFLGLSSSLTPGVPWDNVAALLEGLAWYRTHGRETA